MSGKNILGTNEITAVKVTVGGVVLPKNNYSAIVSPSNINDETEGYSSGSVWVNVVNDQAYTCTNSTTNSASWTQSAQGVTGIQGIQGVTGTVGDPVTSTSKMIIGVDSEVKDFTLPEGSTQDITLDNYGVIDTQNSSWSATVSLNTARFGLGGLGTQSATVSFGGFAGHPDYGHVITEKFNGSIWTNSGNLNTGRYYPSGCGKQNAGLCFGGILSAYLVSTEKFDGSTWTSTGNMNIARSELGGAGTQSAALSFGGFNSSNRANTETFNGSTWTSVSGGDLNTSRSSQSGCGTQGAALSFGGFISAVSPITEKFNGTTWSTSGSLNNATNYGGGAGTQSAALSFGATVSATGSSFIFAEKFNGSTWSITGGGSLNRSAIAGSGTQGAALSFGGSILGVDTAVTEKFNGPVQTTAKFYIIDDTITETDGSDVTLTSDDYLSVEYDIKPYLNVDSSNELTDLTTLGIEGNDNFWETSGDLNTARSTLGGTGTLRASLSFGGTSYTSITEQFDGTVWSSSENLNVPKQQLAGCGIQRAALSFGGTLNGPATEKFNGISWSFAGSLLVDRYNLGGAGTQSAGLSFGGTNKTDTEKFNGSVWAATGGLNITNTSMGSAGTQTAALCIGGALGVGGTSYSTSTEKFDNATWSITGSLNVGREKLAGSGTQSAALSFGGDPDGTSIQSETTEKFNGSTWTITGDLNTARENLAGSGSQNGALSFGGFISAASSVTEKRTSTQTPNSTNYCMTLRGELITDQDPNAGITGETGIQGITGILGIEGVTGVQGVTGLIGETGAGDTEIIIVLKGEDGIGNWDTSELTNATFANNETTPLNGDADFKFGNVTGSANEIVWSENVDVPLKSQNRMLGVNLAFTSDGDASDVTVHLYDVTNSIYLGSESSTVGVGKRMLVTGFGNGTASIKVGFEIEVVNDGTFFYADDLEFTGNPVEQVQITELTDWVAYTPTGTWTTNTTYTGLWKRVGDTLEVDGYVALSGAPDATLLYIDLPFGWVIDTSKLGNDDTSKSIGTASIEDTGSRFEEALVNYYNTTRVGIVYQKPSTTLYVTTSNAVTNLLPHVFANSDKIHFRYSVPIVGWTSSSEGVVHTGVVEVEELFLHTGNGYGSTDTKIRKYVNSAKDTSSKLFSHNHGAYGTAGLEITALQPCTITMDIVEVHVSPYSSGISLNSTQLTTDVTTITAAHRVSSFSHSSGLAQTATSVGEMVIGDILRPHTTTINDSSYRQTCKITAVPNARTVITPLAPTYWQLKYLTSDISSSQTVSDLTFNSLTIGNTYRVTGQWRFNADDSDSTTTNTLIGYNGTDVIFTQRMYWSCATALSQNFSDTSSTLFVATGTTLTFDTTLSAVGQLNGNSTKSETFVILEEVSDYYETDKW